MQDAALTDPNHGQRIPREMFFQSSVTKKMFIEQPMALKAFSVLFTYHTGRHPLGKIREENRNIQNYQTSIKYEL